MSGSKPGERRGGRRKGTPNKRTTENQVRTKELAAVIEAALDQPFDGDAHALLMLVYKDRKQPIELRLDAAGKAIRYEKPALAAIDVTSQNEHVVHTISDKPITSPEEWEQHHVSH